MRRLYLASVGLPYFRSGRTKSYRQDAPSPDPPKKKTELEAAINATEIHTPKCPVYQNVDALPHTDPTEIKKNLVAQLTASVRWTQSVKNMVADGATDFTECGPGAVLQGLIKKIDGTVNAHGIA